jgi:hypothetical protein
MRYGVALEECVRPEHDRLLRALDAFAERAAMPHLLPIWVRGWDLDRRILRSVRERGVEPVLYIEPGAILPPACDIREVAYKAGDGTVVRFAQEPDGALRSPWREWGAEEYRDNFDFVRETMQEAADVLLFWCPTINVTADYWPGVADVLGFDGYFKKDDARLPSERWQVPVERCRTLSPETPIWIGECGWKAGIEGRAAGLRDLPQVEGVDAVIVMDMLALRPDGGFDDWRFNGPMDRAFKGLMSAA